MTLSERTKKMPQAWSRRLIGAVLVGFLIWVAFFDSHSMFKRVRWHQEYVRLAHTNEVLERQIDSLETQLKAPLSDEVVEQIAREEYGMRRPGERVYRVDTIP